MTTFEKSGAGAARSGSSPPTSSKPTRSLTELLELVDPAKLSPKTRETIRTIGSLLASGWSRRQVACELGITEEAVSWAIEQMREAIAVQALKHGDELAPALQERLRAELEASRRRLGKQ